MPDAQPTNKQIANVLEQIADLLEAQDANLFRVRAYRNGAQTVREAQEPVAGLAQEGRQALQSLPGIGKGLAGVITEYVRTGRSSLLARLQGEVAPEDLFSQLPGIGDTLAERIATELDVDTLEELEEAAYDGRLQEVEGFGPKRIRSVRTSLGALLSRAVQRRIRRQTAGQKDDETAEDTQAQENRAPSAGTLLQVDAEYRRQAKAGELRKIAPKRFNPDQEAWLPILHTEKGEYSFTALYSNTARAHDLGKTHDWVVIYYERDGNEGQATIVTEQSGPLKGKRVVRGREQATRRYYEENG
jgi:hypothetical protein